MVNRNKHTPLERYLKIAYSLLLKLIKTVLRLLFVVSILMFVAILLGSIASLLVTIVVLLDNPGASLIECFWEYYVRNFKLLIKVFGIAAIVLFMVVPVRVFFDD